MIHRNSAPSTEAVLNVCGLTVRRGSMTILRGIDWTVKPNEHWVLLGANGSGKTSLLSALTGYLTPTAGDVTVLGQTFGKSDWQRLKTRIGLVSSSIRQLMAGSEPALETVISGKYGMIDLWRRVTPGDRRRARRILRQLECLPLADRPWVHLSQGERQRILIGRALMAKPRILILDEPCAGLDPVAREHFLQWLQRLGARADSPALTLVTHHVEEIVPAFSHALILSRGRALASGPIRKVLRSAVLSQAFQSPVELRRSAGRWQMRVTTQSRAVV